MEEGRSRGAPLAPQVRVDGSALEVLPEGERRLACVDLVGGSQALGTGNVGRLGVLVCQARKLRCGAYDRFEDGFPFLCHRHAERLGAPAAVDGRYLEVDRREARHGEIVRREGDGARDTCLGPGGAEGDRGDVPAVRPPDLPLG